jgi:hypothetical protein
MYTAVILLQQHIKSVNMYMFSLLKFLPFNIGEGIKYKQF